MVENPHETFKRLTSTLPAYEQGLMNGEGRKNKVFSAFMGRALYFSSVQGGDHKLVMSLCVTDFAASPHGAHAEVTTPGGDVWYVQHVPTDVLGSGLMAWLPVHARLDYAFFRGELSLGFNLVVSVPPGYVVEDHATYARRLS